MRGQYDRPASTEDGAAFENLVDQLHRDMLGEDIGLHDDAFRQIAVGESALGVEIKWLKNSVRRLHIEIEHRTSTSSAWRTGGIYRDDNAKRYVCGNNDDIWAFSVKELREWHASHSDAPEVWYGKNGDVFGMLDPTLDDVRALATIRSIVLEKDEAIAFYRYRFIRGADGRYELRRRGFVGYDGAGRFVHYCYCGAFGPFGFNHFPREGKMGKWYCREHREEGAKLNGAAIRR
jgi:hypothetical protein